MLKGMAFSEVLHGRPLIFTALLLGDSKTGDKVHDEKIVNNLNSKKNEIAKEIRSISRLNAISVPELIEESLDGKPSYNSIYTRALASGSAHLLHKDAIVNKVIAHVESYEKFVEWVSETYS